MLKAPECNSIQVRQDRGVHFLLNDLPQVEEFGFSFEKYKSHMSKAE